MNGRSICNTVGFRTEDGLRRRLPREDHEEETTERRPMRMGKTHEDDEGGWSDLTNLSGVP